jgi:hypothetical protein
MLDPRCLGLATTRDLSLLEFSIKHGYQTQANNKQRKDNYVL